jgi:hypothetical protein
MSIGKLFFMDKNFFVVDRGRRENDKNAAK